jgi:hypothetical protein
MEQVSAAFCLFPTLNQTCFTNKTLFLIVKYFSLDDINQEFNLESASKVEEMRNEIILNKNFNQEEFFNFLSVQTNETRIFNGWIEQNKSLKNLLIHQTAKEKFTDSNKWREHALFDKFKSYIGPFFLVLLQKKALSEISEEWATIFSYFELIDDENRLFLEQSLYLGIRNKIDQSLSICNNKSITETDFHQQLLFLLSDACIAIHNSLSRASHHLKIAFTEQILQLFYHPSCSAKLAHCMILQLEKINLNEEQKKSLQTIKQKIKLGEIQFSHQPQKDKQSIVKNVSLLVLGLALIGIIYFLVNQNFEVTTQNYRDASSLASFSIKERKEIDSLIRSMKENENDSVTIDENYFGSYIILRKPFENMLAEKIYRDLAQDMSNHFGGVYDTTISISESKLSDELISKTMSLKALKEKNELEWKNVSEYTLILFAWNEDSNSPVYSGIIAPKKTLKFSSIKNMRIMAVPGIGYGKIPTKNGKEFQILKNHFCAIDFNFEYATQQVYTLSKNAFKTNKILIEGKLGEVVGISDSQGVLDIE